jgi:hypothetical protein
VSEKRNAAPSPSLVPARGGASARGGAGAAGPAAAPVIGAAMNQEVVEAIGFAQSGDTVILQEMMARGVDVTAVMGDMWARSSSRESESTVAQAHAEPAGAMWADVTHRTEEAEELRAGMGRPPEVAPVAEVAVPEAKLPPAVEIHDMGPAQRWDSVGTDMATSEEAGDSDRIAELLVNDLGTNLAGMPIHLDRPAWRVASTYNAEAVIVDREVYLHRNVEERISDELAGPELGASLDTDGSRLGGLVSPSWRPPFLRHSGSAVVITDGGYTIEMKNEEVIVFDETGEQITRIWGDPHVNEGKGGDDWHFGEDSTFILPDGTKICLDTEPNSAGEWYVVGVDVLGGSQRYHYGVGGKQGMTQDAEDFDLAHEDTSKDKSAGVFALAAGNQWAKMGADGEFYDVNDESWGGYLATRDVTAGAKAEVNDRQKAVAGDKDLKAQAKSKKGKGAGDDSLVASRRESTETKAWVAAQQVEVDAQTGKVIDPLRYMPQAVEIDDRGEPNYIPGIEREMAVSQPHGDSARAGQLLKPKLGIDFSRYDVHIDHEAQKVAWAYNANAVLFGQSLYVHADLVNQIEVELEAPAVDARGAGAEETTRDGFLIAPKWRPPFARLSGSEIVITPSGYTIEMKGADVIVYDETGEQITHIWGDPHVNEGKGGDNWHFGQDSTFILPDGSKLCLDTEQNAHGEWYVVGVDVLSGRERYHYGVGDKGGMTEDALAWDKDHKDAAADASAGVFALQENGQWAIMAKDGKFYDVRDESWQSYLKDKDVDFDPNSMAKGLTEKQIAVADDRDLARQEAAQDNGWGRSRPVTSGGKRYHRFESMKIEAELMMLLRDDKIVQRRIG